MIEDIGRCVAQKLTFRSHTIYERHSAPAHGQKVVRDENVVHGSVYESATKLDLKVGEAMAVWELDPDEDRTNLAIERSLAPVPSRLLVRTADKMLLELNPAYLHINNRPHE